MRSKNLAKAKAAGVDIPKGILIVGMPGCGKSLTAKASAALFKAPLLRLDIGKLLGKYVGESEENLRKALKVAEALTARFPEDKTIKESVEAIRKARERRAALPKRPRRINGYR